MIIKSLNNEYIKSLVKLKNKKYRDLTGTYLIEGEHLVKEAFKNNLIKKLILKENSLFKLDADTIYVSEEILKKLTDNESAPSIMAVVRKKNLQEINGNIVILDGIQDPGNLGTIIRNCVAFGIENLILSTDTVDLYNSKVIRATQGMIFNLNIQRKDLFPYINSLKEHKYQILGTNVIDGQNLLNIKISQPYAIIFGNEGNGVKKEINDLCDDLVYIKLSSNCESLNVGVASGIILHAISK